MVPLHSVAIPDDLEGPRWVPRPVLHFRDFFKTNVRFARESVLSFHDWLMRDGGGQVLAQTALGDLLTLFRGVKRSPKS